MALRLFRRPGPARQRLAAGADAAAELRSTVSRIAIVSDDQPAAADCRARLLRIVAEAVVLQDAANDLLADIRDREPLAELAPRGGPLASRFFELRRQLPRPTDLATAAQCESVSVILDHHGTLIVSALQMLSMDWRSAAIVEQLERLDGLGGPAERLDAIYSELARRQTTADMPPSTAITWPHT
jgi:hypothetical protein